MQSGTYDFEANKALLKLYQFFPDLCKPEIVALMLAKVTDVLPFFPFLPWFSLFVVEQCVQRVEDKPVTLRKWVSLFGGMAITTVPRSSLFCIKGRFRSCLPNLCLMPSSPTCHEVVILSSIACQEYFHSSTAVGHSVFFVVVKVTYSR